LFLHSPKDIQANAKGGKFMQKDLTYLSPSVFVLCFLGQQAAVYLIKWLTIVLPLQQNYNQILLVSL
jgi:hypothetical protein